MKNVLLSIFNILVILIFILIFFTLYGRGIRQNEINTAMVSSMNYAMSLLLFDEGRPENNAEWETLFIDAVRTQIESASDLTIHIYEINMEQGLLSAEGILTFTHPIGTKGRVTSEKRTVIMEEFTYEH